MRSREAERELSTNRFGRRDVQAAERDFVWHRPAAPPRVQHIVPRYAEDSAVAVRPRLDVAGRSSERSCAHPERTVSLHQLSQNAEAGMPCREERGERRTRRSVEFGSTGHRLKGSTRSIKSSERSSKGSTRSSKGSTRSRKGSARRRKGSERSRKGSERSRKGSERSMKGGAFIAHPSTWSGWSCAVFEFTHLPCAAAPVACYEARCSEGQRGEGRTGERRGEGSRGDRNREVGEEKGREERRREERREERRHMRSAGSVETRSEHAPACRSRVEMVES